MIAVQRQIVNILSKLTDADADIIENYMSELESDNRRHRTVSDTSRLEPCEWETIDAWKERTGQQYHPESPVWVYECTGTLVDTYDWSLRDYRYSCIYGCTKVLSAINNLGKPNEDS